MDIIQELGIDIFLNSSVADTIRRTLDTIALVQENLFALANNEDNRQLDLLKIGTVFQLFLIDTLASGKKTRDLTGKDWENIATKVSEYAVLEDRQSYSEFVFTLYADYIDLSVSALQALRIPHNEVTQEESTNTEFDTSDEENKRDYWDTRLEQIKSIADEIRSCSSLMQGEDKQEVEYIEKCLWLSLEAMIKLLSYWFTSKLGAIAGVEYAQLAQAAVDLAFEYGRYVLYAKEQAILEAYIQNQYVLDDELRIQYEAFLVELEENAARFRNLIDDAFSPDIQNALMQSAALARAAGVKEEEILSSTEDIDSFFLD